jgi:hypothetical protein
LILGHNVNRHANFLTDDYALCSVYVRAYVHTHTHTHTHTHIYLYIYIYIYIHAYLSGSCILYYISSYKEAMID